MIEAEDIIRRLRTVRHSPRSERNARRALSMNAIARQTGLSRNCIYMIAATGRLAPDSLAKLNAVLTCNDE